MAISCYHGLVYVDELPTNELLNYCDEKNKCHIKECFSFQKMTTTTPGAPQKWSLYVGGQISINEFSNNFSSLDTLLLAGIHYSEAICH
jgi:hypothetical protein